MKKNRFKKRKEFTKRMKIKLAGVFFVTLLALLCLLVGITVINAKEGHRYTKQVLSQSQKQYTNTTVPFQRGTITDRNGNVLAYSLKTYRLVMDCTAVNYKNEQNEYDYRETTLDAVEDYFGINRETMEEILDDPATSSSQYQILLEEVSLEEKKEYEELNSVPDTEEEQEALEETELQRRREVQGIYFEENYKRIYPLNSLACDVIGFADDDAVASWGLEGYYNSTLSGTTGRKYGYFNEDSSLQQNIIDPVNGKNLTTTLDSTIQEITEKYIEAFNEAMMEGPLSYKNTLYEGTKDEKELRLKDRGAENIGVIVADPNNGEILAMASSDPYDLNDPRNLTDLYSATVREDMSEQDTAQALFDLWGNFCVSDSFELGSVFKPITVAAALESGAVTEDDQFLCDGGEQIGTDYVRCAVWPNAHGMQTLGEVIQNSCNDGTMAVARKMGIDEFMTYQKKFNFGTKTGIDLPGEGTGLLFDQENMKQIELETSGFGQGFTATMIQEIAAVSAAINGGTYYQPHLVKEITDGDGKVVESISPNVLKKVISPDVSKEIREYMGLSVESGTSQSSKVQGYSMGGKTGTAEKLKQTADNKEEGIETKNYVVSYVGFAPLDDPQVIIYVAVDTPNAESQASSQYAQYIAQAIFSEVLPYMSIYPDEEGAGETVLWEGFSGVPKFTDIVIDGIDNPRGESPQGSEEEISSEEELNDQYTEGISNEDAGYSEEDSEASDYGEDLYGADGSYLGDTQETQEEE